MASMVSNGSISHELQPGELFCDRYRIRKRIADGGMASIYLAVDEVSGLHVAIKVLFSHYLDNTVIRTRFLDEGRIQAMLRHPNIVHVYRVLSNPILCFVMEFVDGATLEEYLQQRGSIKEGEILELILPVMSAVGFAHSKGIIHRDIKPSNILVKRIEGFLEPKVMDFGVAKVTSGRDLTAAGTTVGTLHYMSPEQIVGSRSIDGRADIYSLGVTLYKLSTGEVPFNASTEFALMMAQVEATPTAPRVLRKEVSRGMEEVILRALEKEPARRFQSIKEFTSALMSLRGHSKMDTDTRPIPAELLKYAMMADEVAMDRTAEITFEHIEALEEHFPPPGQDTRDIEETTDLISPRMDHILEQDAQEVQERRVLPPSALGELTDETELDTVSTIPRDADLSSADLETRENKRPASLSKTMEDDEFSNLTDEQTTLWTIPGEPRKSRGIVALDKGADSREVTGLKVSEEDYRKALNRAQKMGKPLPRRLFHEADDQAPASHQAPSTKKVPQQGEKNLEESTLPDRPSAYVGLAESSAPLSAGHGEEFSVSEQRQQRRPMKTFHDIGNQTTISKVTLIFGFVVLGAVLLFVTFIILLWLAR